MSDHKELDDFLAQLCTDFLDYNATFVPQSASRNSGEKQKSLNWRVTLKNRKRDLSLATDYMQGIGHVPGYTHNVSSHDHRCLRNDQDNAAETGNYPAVRFNTATEANGAPKYRPAQAKDYEVSFFRVRPKRLPVPSLRDILYSLVLDSQSVDSVSFEEWAESLGYDIDSRKAKRIYDACREIQLDLQRVIGQPTIARLDGLFQGY